MREQINFYLSIQSARHKMYLVDVVLLYLLFVHVCSERCTTPNGEEADCIPVRNCSILVDAILQGNSKDFLKESQCGYYNGSPLVCCGSKANFISPAAETLSNFNTSLSSKMELLPSKRYCGYQHYDDYLHPEDSKVTSIHEFPWLVALLYTKRDGGNVEILCAGTLISNRYVLTAGHCLIPIPRKLVGVRLGEYNIRKSEDCVKSSVIEEECTDPTAEYGIEEKFPHPGYTVTAKQHDIGLVRLNRTVTYSDYIRPICLPFPGTNFAKISDKFLSSGWGRLKIAGVSLTTDVKKKILLKLLPIQRCVEEYKVSVETVINENQICTEEDEDVSDTSCQGDSGGPLIFSNSKNQWHIEGIISFGKKDCTSHTPAVNTNVVSYLNWILENIKK